MAHDRLHFVTSVVKLLSWTRIRQAGLTITDQVLAVGGMFLVNVILARTQSKYEYGIFALSYSVFTFLAGLHNAAILETFTVYGSGRYQRHFPAYVRLLWRTNILLGLGLTVFLSLLWRVLASTAPALASRTALGMALTCGILLTATFVRRIFYLRRRPDLAAKFSMVFFCTCIVFLWIIVRVGVLDGFWGFMLIALSWIIAGLVLLKELHFSEAKVDFTEIEPTYWDEHWKYSRWVLLTALVFQLTMQGYLWLAAVLLSVKETGNLRALYNVVLPMDQLFAAMSMVVLPVMCSRYAMQRMAGLVPLWKTYCSGWFLVSCGFVGIVFFWGRPGMHLLYRSRFDNISSLLPILAFLPVVVGIGHTVNGALKAAEKPKLIFFAYIISGVTTFVLGVPLVIHLGLQGAVYGMILSGAAYSLALLSSLYFVARHDRRTLNPHPLPVEGKL